MLLTANEGPPLLSHTVHQVAQQEEGGVHSGLGFEDGPCCLQPGGLTKVTSLPPTPSCSVPPMAPSPAVALAKPVLCTLSPTWVPVPAHPRGGRVITAR